MQNTPNLERATPDGPGDGDILALIPAYNESHRIGRVIREARNYLPVLVVDDGSSDRTADSARQAGALVMRMSPNQGKGAALRAGFRHALETGCPAVLTLDADGQHDPDDIPKFIDCFTASIPDLIIGYRDFSQIPPVRRLANSLGRVTFSWAVGRHIPDNQSGYRLINRRLMSGLLSCNQVGFEFEVEMIKFAIQKEYQIEWVPIRTIYAGESSHISPIKHISNFLHLVIKTRRDMSRIP